MVYDAWRSLRTLDRSGAPAGHRGWNICVGAHPCHRDVYSARPSLDHDGQRIDLPGVRGRRTRGRDDSLPECTRSNDACGLDDGYTGIGCREPDRDIAHCDAPRVVPFTKPNGAYREAVAHTER
jgi:hypothetical protein